jgi:hypothetical protein
MTPQTKEEIEQLLAIAEGPDPSPGAVRRRSPSDLISAFLRDNEIRPGKTGSIEIASFYRFFLQWSDRLAHPPKHLGPLQFARLLKLHRFQRNRRQRRQADGGRDRRLLGVNHEAAGLLIAWLAAHPDDAADRLLFNPRHRHQKELKP